MNTKTKIKIIIDIFMTFGLLFLMGYQFWGETAHEWAGGAMFILFIIHHILNMGWYKGLFKGRYTPFRILQTAVNFMLLASMLALMISGITMSHCVFTFIHLNIGMSLARKLHILGAYWGFVLMSFHLGLHWNMFIGMAKRKERLKNNKAFLRIFTAIGVLTACYGIWVFIKRNLLTYMLLRSEFVFLDYSESALMFYIDYLSMMGFFIFAAHYGARILKKFTSGMERKTL
ncbi:MAG: DUF4405 domain-containing protein [Clostridiales bacterium]|nr:DUF4405 domain-containing protein [Clostridiales bacterium]